MFIDFSEIKEIVTDLKRDLREDTTYGYHSLLLRSKGNLYTSGSSNDDIYDLGFISGNYTNTIIRGIKEYIPKGFTRKYTDLAVENNGDIRFTVEQVSGQQIIDSSKNSIFEIWSDYITDVSGAIVLKNDIPSGAIQYELMSYCDDMFKIEKVFWFNIK